jgi:hypothetical protein
VSDPIERSPFSTNYADSTPEQKAKRRRDLKAASARASRAKWTPEQRAAEAARVARRRDDPDAKADEIQRRYDRSLGEVGSLPRSSSRTGGERLPGMSNETLEVERRWRDEYLAPQIKQAQDSLQLRSWGYFESVAYKPTSLVAVQEKVETFVREQRKDDHAEGPSNVVLLEGRDASVARGKSETEYAGPRGRQASYKNDVELIRYVRNGGGGARGSSSLQPSGIGETRQPSKKLTPRELSATRESRLERAHQRAIQLGKRGTYNPPRGD